MDVEAYYEQPSIGSGNIKLGPVPSFSIPSKLTCPGASPWCLQHCYAARYERLRTNCREAYARNLVLTWDSRRFIRKMLEQLPEDAPCMRIHVSGDFYSQGYIRAWLSICTTRPNTQFWAYTRSWTQPHLLPALEELRALPHVNLFASTDPAMPLPPAGWRIAFIESDPRAHGLPCPEQHAKTESCLTCGYCYRNRQGNVVFKVH